MDWMVKYIHQVGLVIMNKNDIKLIVVVFVVVILSIILLNIFKKNGSFAKVYYEDDLILTIDLSKDNNYKVDGYNGEVLIEVKDNKIRVEKENSPKHLCSKQGFIDSTMQTIVCLPNKIIIEIEGNKELDGVVK